MFNATSNFIISHSECLFKTFSFSNFVEIWKLWLMKLRHVLGSDKKKEKMSKTLCIARIQLWPNLILPAGEKKVFLKRFFFWKGFFLLKRLSQQWTWKGISRLKREDFGLDLNRQNRRDGFGTEKWKLAMNENIAFTKKAQNTKTEVQSRKRKIPKINYVITSSQPKQPTMEKHGRWA